MISITTSNSIRVKPCSFTVAAESFDLLMNLNLSSFRQPARPSGSRGFASPPHDGFVFSVTDSSVHT